jgi:cytochrome P450
MPKVFDAAVDGLWKQIYNPVTRRLFEMIPRKLVAPFNPGLRRIVALVDEGLSSVKAYRSTEMKGDGPVIFDCLRHLPDEVAGMEAVAFLIAGSDTSALTLGSTVWHMCHDPSIKRKLTAALKEAFPEHRAGEYPALPELESVPYLVACMKEGLRVAMPISGRLPRVVPGAGSVAPLVVDDKVVSPGTVVGISAYTMHNSEELWGSNARSFQPERWLGEDAKGLDEHLVTFSKGARNCIGQTLARADIIVVLYMLFRNFDIELDAASEKGVLTSDNFTKKVLEPGLMLKMRPIT